MLCWEWSLTRRREAAKGVVGEDGLGEGKSGEERQWRGCMRGVRSDSLMTNEWGRNKL